MGTSLDYYRCIQVYMAQIGADMTCDTLVFFLHSILIQKTTTEDYVNQAINNIITLLSNLIAYLL